MPEPAPGLWCLGRKYAKPNTSATLHWLRPRWRNKTLGHPSPHGGGFIHSGSRFASDLRYRALYWVVEWIALEMKAALPTSHNEEKGNGPINQPAASAARGHVNLDISDKRPVISVIIECRNAQHAGDKPCDK
jgi:hypothetical protein